MTDQQIVKRLLAGESWRTSSQRREQRIRRLVGKHDKALHFVCTVTTRGGRKSVWCAL